ncbi:MAG: hypothetical protein EAZ97_04420 [Bacteroidetes bacterium]|nr:MAG: hypothetical protein EAZ97_04420 [Bacteroidota bacterium]
MFKKIFLLAVLTIIFAQNIFAQRAEDWLKDLELKIDTSVFSWKKDQIRYQNNRFLAFSYQKEEEIVEIRIFTRFSNIQKISLQPSADYEILDSLIFLEEEYFKTRIKFKNLTKSQFLTFIFKIKTSEYEFLREIPLFPYAKTEIGFQTPPEELFIGEEKTFDLISNLSNNIRTQEMWVTSEKMDYKITKNNGKLKLHVIPNVTGNIDLNLKISIFKPFLDERKRPIYDFTELKHTFKVKSSRLAFLNVEPNEVILDDKANQGIEIQLDDTRGLKLEKTYRIEKQESAGGALLGEIFTRSRLTNNRILCWLRFYTYHRKIDGYLYIKDGDQAKFITNFDIVHKTNIEKISILREKSEWTTNLTVFPNENISLKIEGQGLSRSNFQFESQLDLKTDSTIKTDNVVIYDLKVPSQIASRKITLYNHENATSYALNISEYQKASELDFIQIDLGDEKMPLKDFTQPLLYSKTIRDITISFLPEKLDSAENFVGKQHLTIDVKIMNKANQLVEINTIENVVVCPSENSLRGKLYVRTDCQQNMISLNTYLARKTHDLDEWSRIEITFKHKESAYPNQKTFSKKIEIILKRKYSFDIDLSFPGGLIVKKLGEQGYGSFNGVSMSVLAQFKFYKNDKIERLQPYRIGVGTLAFNVFNLNDNSTNRDLAVVVLGSVFPTRKDVKLSLPLYAGFGYMIKEEKWFFVLGPGLRIQL